MDMYDAAEFEGNQAVIEAEHIVHSAYEYKANRDAAGVIGFFGICSLVAGRVLWASEAAAIRPMGYLLTAIGGAVVGGSATAAIINVRRYRAEDSE